MQRPSPTSIRVLRVLHPDAYAQPVPAEESPVPAAVNDAIPTVGALLRTVRDQLGMDVAFLTELRGDTQLVVQAESRIPLPIGAGDVVPRAGSVGQLVWEGTLPTVLGEVARHPVARELPAATLMGVGAYVCVPVTLGDGTVLLVSAAQRERRVGLGVAAVRTMEVVAAEVVRYVRESRDAAREHDDSRRRVEAVLAAGGPEIVCQPVVDLASGERLGVEVLARFADGRGPDRWFAEAALHGLGVDLELAVARKAAALFDRLPGAVGINLSPRALLDPRVGRLLATLPADRLVVEMTEHEEVDDYDALAAVLTPLRRRGASLAVDDAGAGFASLRHVLRLGPDWIKIDHAIVHDVDVDPARAALLAALVVFAEKAGMHLCAEGLETAAEVETATRLGAHCGQGWHLGRPVPAREVAGYVAPEIPVQRVAVREPVAG